MQIITSIMNNGNKEDLKNQLEAVRSWINIGFDVVSVNIKEEIKVLSSAFSEVEFIEPKRTGLKQYGKPIPYIFDMLQILEKKSGDCDEICGIINSDIYLRNLNRDDLQKVFVGQEETIVCFHRYDIDSRKDLDGEYYFSGIDAFFMQKKSIRIFRDSDCALSKPEWDHWVVYTAVKNQIRVREIKNAIAFHVRHRQRWTASESNAIGSGGKEDAHGEEYYDLTNRAMEDLDNQLLLGEGVPEEVLRVEVSGGGDIYLDKDIYRLAAIEMERHHAGAVKFPIGVGYYKKTSADCKESGFYRICAMHGDMEKEDAVYVYKSDGDRHNCVQLGEIAAYVDFMKTKIAVELRRFYIYPAGRAGRMLLDCCLWNEKRPLGFVDKDKMLQGTTYKGTVICNPKVLKRTEEYDQVLLASNLYVDEIYKELINIVPKEKLIII